MIDSYLGALESVLQEIFCSEKIAYLAGFKVRTPDEVLPILQTFIQDSQKSLCAKDRKNRFEYIVGFGERNEKGIYKLSLMF